MDLLKKNKYLAGVLIALSYCVLVLPVTEAAWFDIEYLKQDQLLFSTITKGLFFLTLTAISIFALHFIEKVRNKDQFYRTWLMYSGLYAGVMAIILLFIWPGYWQWDELDVLNASQHYDIFSWQSIHTQLQYIFSLYILPFMTGITILQILAVSFISGYIVARVKKIITRKKLLYLLLIPLTLSPVIILSNFYTLRTQLLAYLILLLLFKLLLLVQERAAHISNKYVTFIGFSFLIALISTWRSENIVYLPILIFLWFYLGLYRSLKKQWKATLASTVGSLVIVVFFFGLSRFTADPSYSMTINLNTLQMIVHSDLKEGAEKDLAAINKSIDVEILKKYPSYCDIDSFWYGTRDYDTPLLRKDWQKKDNIESYKRGVFSLFLHNPGPFMTYRLKTYLATNFMDKDAPGRCNMSINTGQFITNHAAESAHIHGLSRSFLDANALNRSPNPDMRTNILRFLVATDAQWLRPFIWNVTPALLLCLVILLHSLLRRRFYWTLAMLILFAHTLLIFLSAPAPMFMYYFPLYLSGTILPLIYIILRLNERGSSPKKYVIIGPMMDTEKQRTLIAIPAYNCAPQITRVLGDIDKKLQDRVAEVAVIDNGSTDDTVARALEFKKTSDYKQKLHIYKNNDNYNLGGTHKVAFTKGEKEGFTHVVILHGDNQAKASEVNDLLDFADSNPQQTVLGSRFNKDSRLNGYDKKRIYGNKALNAIYSILTLRKLEDLGSGINLFYLEDLDKSTYLKFADKLTFNYELILDLVKRDVNFAYLPITWSEDDQVSNARNVSIFKTAVANVIRWRLNVPAKNQVRTSYECKEVKDV